MFRRATAGLSFVCSVLGDYRKHSTPGLEVTRGISARRVARRLDSPTALLRRTPGPALDEEVGGPAKRRLPLVKHGGVRLEHVWYSRDDVEGHSHIVSGCATGESKGVAQEYFV